MSIYKNIKLYTLCYIFLMCCTLLLTFPKNVYGGNDGWVLIEKYDDFTTYYNSKLIKIDTQAHIITVWMKGVFSNKWANEVRNSNIKDKLVADELININNQRTLYDFNYITWHYSVNHITSFSHSGKILMDWDVPPEWKQILPNSYFDEILNELLSKYGLKR
jgi:hypothetical protein